MVKRSSFMTPLSLSLFLLLIIIASLQLEASVPMKTFHYVDEKKTWSDARQYCIKEKFTDLASAGYHREDLLNEIEKNGDEEQWIWIGLYRDAVNASVWRWTGERGDASNDANWKRKREPELRNCTYLRSYICTTTDNVTTNCDPGQRWWYWYSAHCSERKPSYCSNGDQVQFESKAMSWFDAQESCNKTSMVLATVTESNQHKFTDSGYGWIGLHIHPNTPGRYTSKDIWKWTGKDSHEFRNWGWGEPDHENCGVLRFPSNTLYSDSCSGRHLFVSVADNVILVKENKTWEEALEHCRAISSVDSSQHNHYRDHQYDLVSLQSEDDHRYARDKIQEATTNEVWTALRFLAGQWLWVDGEPQQYQKLPLCPAWGRHCGTLPKDHSTQWQIRDCMERRNFLCIKSPAG